MPAAFIKAFATPSAAHIRTSASAVESAEKLAASESTIVAITSFPCASTATASVSPVLPDRSIGTTALSALVPCEVITDWTVAVIELGTAESTAICALDGPLGAVWQFNAIFVTFAALIDPDPFATEQFWVGDEGCVATLTAYVAPFMSPVTSVTIPFVLIVWFVPSTSTTSPDPDNPETVADTEYVCGGGGGGGPPPPPPLPPPPPPPPASTPATDKSVPRSTLNCIRVFAISRFPSDWHRRQRSLTIVLRILRESACSQFAVRASPTWVIKLGFPRSGLFSKGFASFPRHPNVCRQFQMRKMPRFHKFYRGFWKHRPPKVSIIGPRIRIATPNPHLDRTVKLRRHTRPLLKEVSQHRKIRRYMDQRPSCRQRLHLVKLSTGFRAPIKIQ